MINDPDTLYKVAGSALGGIGAIVFMPPATLGEFARRMTLSLLSGLILGSPVRSYFEFPDTTQNIIAASFLAALFSWWAIGAGVRALNLWKGMGSKRS